MLIDCNRLPCAPTSIPVRILDTEVPGTVFIFSFFFFQAEDGIRDIGVTGVQTCALPISDGWGARPWRGCRPRTPRPRGAGRRWRRAPGTRRARPPAGGGWPWPGWRAGTQIGRAAGREKGEISVGAVSLKKKNNTTPLAHP